MSQKLGFEFNPKFTNDQGACMILSQDGSVMLLTEPFFRTFTKREICDRNSLTENLLAVSCSSRDEVNQLVNKVVAAGGTHAMEPTDHGFMYG